MMPVDEFNKLRDKAVELNIYKSGMSLTDNKDALRAAGEHTTLKEPPATPKKGKPSWSWRNRFSVSNKDPNFRYRFVDRTDASNLSSKLEDGWVFVNRETGVPGDHNFDVRDLADGKRLDSAYTYREHVLMALPEEIAVERDKAVRSMTEGQTASIKRRVESDIGTMSEGSLKGEAARITGKVTIIE